MRRPKRRHPSGMNPGPMADIAFMMLIFFMVSTTIEMNWGIEMKLAPWTDEEITYSPSEMPTPFRIDINSLNELMVDSKIVEVGEVKWMCKIFIKERGVRSVIIFRTNRRASYELYIEVLNEIKAAYNDLWKGESNRLFNVEYSQTSGSQKRIIRNKYPFALIEKEAEFYLNTY